MQLHDTPAASLQYYYPSAVRYVVTFHLQALTSLQNLLSSLQGMQCNTMLTNYALPEGYEV